MLNNIVFARTSDNLVIGRFFFEESIRQTRFALVVCFRLTKKSIWAQKSRFCPWKSPGEHLFLKTSVTFPCWGFTKKTSSLPRIVWTREFKTGLGLKIGSLQKKLSRCPNIKLMDNPAVLATYNPRERNYTFFQYLRCLIQYHTKTQKNGRFCPIWDDLRVSGAGHRCFQGGVRLPMRALQKPNH